MPGRNGTGPEGMGPLTGRGMGNCSSANNVDTNQKPIGRGMGRRLGFARGQGGRGRGCGMGRGRGFGMGRGMQGRGFGMGQGQGFGRSFQNQNPNQQIEQVNNDNPPVEEDEPNNTNEIVKK